MKTGQLVDAVLQRLANPSEGGLGDVRNVMHEIRHAVIERSRSAGGEGGLAQVCAILRRRAVRDPATALEPNDAHHLSPNASACCCGCSPSPSSPSSWISMVMMPSRRS